MPRAGLYRPNYFAISILINQGVPDDFLPKNFEFYAEVFLRHILLEGHPVVGSSDFLVT